MSCWFAQNAIRPLELGYPGELENRCVSVKNVNQLLTNSPSALELKMNRLKQKYLEEVIPAMMKDHGISNVMQVPTLKKVVVNVGMGEAMDNPNALEAALNDITQITGQKPVVTKARKSIANFKLREGREIGIKVTLRGERMWSFVDRLINVVLPRVRDFRGISANSFDGHGNYTLGLREQLIFPEIAYDKIDKLRGMEITFVTSALTDDMAASMLDLLGMPFRKG
jgi:large subunit ribosomal protein L5